jgi:hypothetical protein
MAAQLSECYAAAAGALPARLSEVEARVQATAQTCADAVKVGIWGAFAVVWAVAFNGRATVAQEGAAGGGQGRRRGAFSVMLR